jgi:hypothetical protein
VKKKLGHLSLHRETLHRLTLAALGGVNAFETGSNPHSACLTCTCVNCPDQTA